MREWSRGTKRILTISSETETKMLGEALARCARPPAFLGLTGPLGAGKTALAQAFLRTLGVEGPIPSPTFLLARRYEKGPHRMVHMDFYRLAEGAPGDDVWIVEALEEADYAVVEWADRAPYLLPDEALLVTLRPLPGHPMGREVEAAFRHEKARTWWECALKERGF
ncbi:MAG: tRNA (adenosine(37)-N6)-threonylcarbamoyltransferase complex ATPase subunit type 1 TsaE [Bacillota bacterium]|nr:tRNA (adenosine(37)-N6)-threonylcarbamoyltransferase complex ATPase subunit type 1 TsaE [Bacillota bacterium]